ncbi:putative phosphosugar-binding protein [Actinopolyspora biskrensis]|uniref:Putative phosphosugar-binding protein n=1 Tax=Actinopolyspora biskrensis TaxID=1470178 RepID=A0A852Z455_9ACTN|nr:SIS domain-containing protein [Actinopolyspora biskrensis]NYH77043.1 putative phosphosugar-binding protein [Actinopolyspora biskrensis]
MPDGSHARKHAERSLHDLDRVVEHNGAALGEAAKLLIECVSADGLVFTAGAGHSLAGVLESFYRAGGLAAVRPLYHPDLLPLHGAATSTATERRRGLAEETLHEAGFDGGTDVLVVFSNSGINPYPVELAATARARGSEVIALTSKAAAEGAPRRTDAGTLSEQATLVLDTLVPPGDTTYPESGPVTAPASSLANVFLWNLLMVEAYERADEDGISLPWWRSSNAPGGDEANASRLEHYSGRITRLR